MANNSPTIVAASLSDEQLKKSIDSLVTHVDEAMKKMVQSTNNAVGEMEAKLKSLGNLKIDSGGSADGGTGRRTQQHEKLTKAVNDASDAVTKETQKLQDLQQSLSGASDREQNFVSQKERAANTIAQENELLSKQQSELAALKTQQQSLANSESLVADAEGKRKAAVATLDAKMKELAETQSRLLQKGSGLTPNERKLIEIDQTTIALIARARKELGELNLTLSNGVKYAKGEVLPNKFADGVDGLKKLIDDSIRSLESLKRYGQEGSTFSGHLWTQEDIAKIDAVLSKYKEYSSVVDDLYSKQQKYEKNHPVMSWTDKYSEYHRNTIFAFDGNKDTSVAAADRALTKAEDELFVAINKSAQASQQKAQIDAQVAAKEKEIAETKGRIATATKEQSEAEKNASQASKEKANIQSQVANQEKQVAEAKRQLTTATQQHTEIETKSSRATKEKTMTLDQQASAINTVVQSEKKYTDEVLRQAAAIRSSKEWQEKGHVVVGDVNYYDKERANVSKRDKQLLLSLEEQIVQAQQKDAQEALVAAEANRQKAQAAKEAAQAMRGVSSYDLGIDPNVSAERQRQIELTRKASQRTEYLRQQVASLLEVEEREVKSVNITTASYSELSQHLKQLQSAYNKLGADRIKKGEGVDLANEIQRTQRAMQKLQQTMSRPVSLKDALGGSEKTLDDIAYKIRMLQSYMQGLDTTNKKSAEEFKRAALNVEILKNKQNELLAKNAQLIGSNNSLIRSNTALGRSWNYMKNRLAFYFTVGASTQFVKNLIEIRSQYEMTERALGILVNSAERGTQIFNELSQMALVSPYTLIELSGAAKQLVAYDVAAKDVVDTTRRLADMASAVGVPMERLTYALGQIKAYGYLNSRDNRMFANAGIPLVKQLADYYTELEGKLVSTADVYDRIKKKAVGYADVMQVITKMTDEGGKFFDFQEKMSGTLKVQIANLTLAWNNMLNEIGASEQGVLTTGIAALKNLFLAWKDLSNTLTTIAAIFGIVKAQQILSNIAIGKSTVSLIGYINANKEATWVEYSRALQTKKLTAAQAAWLLMTNKNNTALAASLVRLKIIDAATARYLTTMKGLSAGLLQLRIMGTMALNGLAKGVKALGAAFMTNLPLVALTAAIDLFTHFSSVASNNKSFNESIATGANEASEALRNFTKEEDKVQARAKAASGNLSDTEAKKVWEAIREQIELSSQAANIFIPQLLSITNINERITAAFDLADKIQEATNKLGELRDEMEVSQDSWLWGLLGEGIGEDLDDYNKRVKELREQAKYFAEGETSVWEDLKIAINGVWDGIGGGSGSQSAKEAVREIEKFANNAADVIKEKLGKEGVLDEKQVTEAVARFVKAAEQQIPEIRGAGKKLFEALTNDIMGKQFEVFNAQEYYYNAFLEQLKKDYGSKFADITEDIKDKTVVWSDAQKKAIKETADKVKKDWPQASRDAIDEILKDLNNTEFKLHLVATFSSDLTDFQQQFNTRANKLGMIVADTLQKFAPQSGDDLPSWTKKQQESIKALREENKNYEKDNSKWAKQRIAANNTEIEGRTKALSLFKQSAISDKDAAKNKKQAESELAKALKDELSTIDKVRSIYKDLTKEGMSHANAVERATRGWDETVDAINRVLQKNGLQKLDLSKFAGIENPRELVNMLQSQLNTLLKRGAKPAEIKELQTKVNTLEVDADKYDLTKITKGLNNELGKLKDEYELAVELDADPELGNAFADMMGINMDALPHTVKEYADRYSAYLNKYLKGKNSALQFTGDELRGLTRDDITAFREQVDAGTFNQEWFDAILKAYEDISGKRKKDLEETEKWKNSLIEKYGGLQAKLTQIFKDSVQNQVNAVKTFGTEDQKGEIIRLQLRIEATDNPAELADINTKIAEIVKDVTDKNPIALKLVTASDKETESKTAKAYWDDFKDSELYTMTFEDMANNSTRAIQLIMDKLESLKDKVKEDPASMKALMKSLEDAEKELNTRDPFGGIARSIKAMSDASKEAKLAQQELWEAEVDVEQAQQRVDESEDASPEEQKTAQDALAAAIQRRANAQIKLTQAENKGKKAQENLKNSLQGLTQQLGNIQGFFSIVSKLFRAGGDDETADAIDSINEGFTIMTQVIMGVMAAMVILESSNPWLLAIAAALSIIVGLVSFLIGNDDKKIVKQIEESQRAVKRLENTYKNLSHTAEESYGALVSGAKKAMQSNKELQLVELKRQLALEKSRDSKHRDEDKIADLEGQIIDLKNEIHDASQDIINDLLDISSAGDGIENLVGVMIEAFRNGEDAMEAFGKEWDKMIDNMILKLIVTQFMKQAWDTVMDNLKKKQEEFLNNPSQAVADAQKEVDRLSTMSDAELAFEIAQKNGTFNAWGWTLKGAEGVGVTNSMIENYKKAAQDALTTATEVLNGQSFDYTKWSLDYMTHEGKDTMMQYAEMLKDNLGDWYTYGQDTTKDLSSLQAGIKGITEDTAGALESYMNSVSQQVYLHSDLLTQIRDTMVGWDFDVQLGALSQILLQLQQSYQVQMSIQGILEGVLTPSGQGFRVELLS